MEKPTKISLFGNFGSMNIGNEATLSAVVSRLRLLSPDSELCCICSIPERATAAHGIPAVAHTVRFARIWDRDAPLHRRVAGGVAGLWEELREYRRVWKTLEGTDVFVVPGTGLLNDAYGLTGWGPYGLAKWTIAARLRRCRVLFVSVGAGPVRTALGRLLLKRALSLADYRSFRDGPSREVVVELGVPAAHDPIYPDLVFGMEPERLPASNEGARRRVVGVGLMEHAGGYGSASLHAPHERYLESLARLVRWLLDNDYDVKLLLGDSDTAVVDELKSVLKQQPGSFPADRVSSDPVTSPEDLFLQLVATDFVVATRFHNVLMSLMLGKPVIAITFHHKSSSLMDEMGLSEYCHDIADIDGDRLVEQFQALVRNADELRDAIGRHVDEERRAVDEQYQLLFGSAVERPTARAAAA